MFRLSLPRFFVAPKKRRSIFMARRRRLLFFLDKYRFKITKNFEHYRRCKEGENLWLFRPVNHPFRYPGFWGDVWDFPQVGVPSTADKK